MTIIVDKGVANLLKQYDRNADRGWNKPQHTISFGNSHSLTHLDLLMQADSTVCVLDPRISLFFQVQYDISSTGVLPPAISRGSIILIDDKGEPPVLVGDGETIVNQLFLEKGCLYDISL